MRTHGNRTLMYSNITVDRTTWGTRQQLGDLRWRLAYLGPDDWASVSAAFAGIGLVLASFPMVVPVVVLVVSVSWPSLLGCNGTEDSRSYGAAAGTTISGVVVQRGLTRSTWCRITLPSSNVTAYDTGPWTSDTTPESYKEPWLSYEPAQGLQCWTDADRHVDCDLSSSPAV